MPTNRYLCNYYSREWGYAWYRKTKTGRRMTLFGRALSDDLVAFDSGLDSAVY